MSARDTTAYAKNIPVRGNVTSGMDRILDKPRARVWNVSGYAAVSAGGISWNFAEYDTDGMTSVTTSQGITCRTAGTYIVQGHAEYTSGTGPRWTRLIINGDTAVIVAGLKTGNATPDSTSHDICGLWQASAGDNVILYVQADSDTSNVSGGQYILFMSACLIST